MIDFIMPALVSCFVIIGVGFTYMLAYWTYEDEGNRITGSVIAFFSIGTLVGCTLIPIWNMAFL